MGRGDKKTRKGKITAGSYGNSRPRGAGKVKYVPTDAATTAKPKAKKKAAASKK